MYKEYITQRLHELKTVEEKIEYLEKIISDSWKGFSFMFISNAMGMREAAGKELRKLQELNK